MDRRTLLRTLGLTTAGLLTACSRTGGTAAPAPTTAAAQSPGAMSLDDLAAGLAPNADRKLSVELASFEQLTGTARTIAFGLRDQDNEPIPDADIAVHVVPNGGQVSPAHPTDFHQVPGNPLGLYTARIDLTQSGPTAIVAVTADGTATGHGAFEVRTPETSQLLVPGDAAPAVPTPTPADLLGVQALCTRRPPCSMHELSLDDVIGQRPVMVEFSTPAYCQVAICGPSVDVFDQVRTSRDWGDTARIHVEVYADAGETLLDAVQRWSLPSEPWLFAVNRDGTIADRADGPLLVLPDHVTTLAELIA